MTVVPRLVPAIFTVVAPLIDPTFGKIDATDGAATTVGATTDAGADKTPRYARRIEQTIPIGRRILIAVVPMLIGATERTTLFIDENRSSQTGK